MHTPSPQPPPDSSFTCNPIHSRSTACQKSADPPAQNDPSLDFQALTIDTTEKEKEEKEEEEEEESASALLPYTAQLGDLPYEIVHCIANHLNVSSIGALAQTCRHLHAALPNIAIDKMANHYYGPPGSEARRRYEKLYTPLARRLLPATEPNTKPLSHKQGARQRLHHITRLRTLSQSGKLCPTREVLQQNDYFDLLTCGLSMLWGACALIRKKVHSHTLSDRELLNIVVIDPSPSFMAVPPTEQPSPYWVDSAQIVPTGHIVTAGMAAPDTDTKRHFMLTACRHNNQGNAVQHTVLAGTHGAKIIRFEQLPDGRIVSASHDGTLKIRSIKPPDQGPVTTLTGHLAEITDMLIFAGSRCITSSYDQTLKIWDLSQPSKERCLLTLADIPRVITELHRLSENCFLSASCPNIVLVWQLTDNGCNCNAMLDPDWPNQLPADGARTGREPPYDLTAEPVPQCRLGQYLFTFQVLPDGRIAVNHWSGIRLCDSTASRAPERLCILDRNSSGAVTRSVPICPAGVLINPPKPYFQPTSLLADGRTVHANIDATLDLYTLDHTNTTERLELGPVFSDQLPHNDEIHPPIQRLMVMADGRLFACAQRAGPTTFFVICDPYAQGKRCNPIQRAARHACSPL